GRLRETDPLCQARSTAARENAWPSHRSHRVAGEGEMLNLNRLLRLRRTLVAFKRWYLTRVFGMDIHPTVQFSLSAYFDKTYPKGVHVGPNSWVALQSVVLTHDRTRGLYLDTRVGE